MDAAYLNRQGRRDRRAHQRFARGLGQHGPKWPGEARPRGLPAGLVWPGLVAGAPLAADLLRRGLVGLAVAGLAMVLAVASQVGWGYLQHPAAYWGERLAQRQGSPIYSADGYLVGALFPPEPVGASLNFADYGYLRGDTELPPLWVAFVAVLEQKALLDPWRNWCGLDPVSIAKRVFTGTGGGSGLAEQAARNLAMPEERRSAHAAMRVVQKVRLWGSACALHQAQGGAQGMLRLFAEYAPLAKVGGTLRGLETGGRVLFDRAPWELAPYQLALLAALVQRPLALAPAAAFARGCPALRQAHPDTLGSDAERTARNHCWVIARARSAVRQVMQGPPQEAAVAALDALERTGIQPANPFAPVPTRRLLSLTLRAHSALGPVLLQHVAAEADRMQAGPGDKIALTMVQPEQLQFTQAVRAALVTMDTSVAGREALCVPLAPATPLRHCPHTPRPGARADVVLARMSVQRGTLERLYESSYPAFGKAEAIGSVGKMVVALAAAGAGYTPASPLCPRRARDGGRWLRRIGMPEHGFEQCAPHQMLTLAEAMGRSDNLAVYELARRLGPRALRAAATAVGLEVDADPRANLAYQLVFGTQAGTPAQLLALGQALFGVAFGVPVQAAGPRLLAAGQERPQAYAQVAALLPQPAQRQVLAELLRAPVQHPGGTLRHLAGTLAAGKTGTTQAGYGPGHGARAYVQAKYTLAYAPRDRSVVLSIIGAPHGHALATHDLRAQALAPAVEALMGHVTPGNCCAAQ